MVLKTATDNHHENISHAKKIHVQTTIFYLAISNAAGIQLSSINDCHPMEYVQHGDELAIPSRVRLRQ